MNFLILSQGTNKQSTLIYRSGQWMTSPSMDGHPVGCF